MHKGFLPALKGRRKRFWKKSALCAFRLVRSGKERTGFDMRHFDCLGAVAWWGPGCQPQGDRPGAQAGRPEISTGLPRECTAFRPEGREALELHGSVPPISTSNASSLTLASVPATASAPLNRCPAAHKHPGARAASTPGPQVAPGPNTVKGATCGATCGPRACAALKPASRATIPRGQKATLAG